MKNVASFEVDGKVYEIMRNRYLLAEFNEIANNSKALSVDEEKGYAILQDKYARLEKIALKVKELEDAYYEDFDDEKGALYEKAKTQYDKVFRETVEFEALQNGIAKKVQKVALDNAEKVVIKALEIDEKGKTIRSQQEATEIWESYVDKVGTNVATEWLLYFVNYLTGNDNADEDPFVSQAKAKAEQKANMKKGLKLIK